MGSAPVDDLPRVGKNRMLGFCDTDATLRIRFILVKIGWEF